MMAPEAEESAPQPAVLEGTASGASPGSAYAKADGGEAAAGLAQAHTLPAGAAAGCSRCTGRCTG
eukprot:3409577-Prymnesium_polylepis.1